MPWLRVNKLGSEYTQLVLFGPGGITVLDKTEDGYTRLLGEGPANGWLVDESINTLEARINIAERGE